MSNLEPTEGQPPKLVQDILTQHQESFILVLDPDPDAEGESTIACFMKFEEKSRLSAYLPTLLQQLLKTSRGKASGSISAQTTINP